MNVINGSNYWDPVRAKIQYAKIILIDREREREREVYLEAEADSSSSQWRMCLTLRLKMVADCLTSLLSSNITALTPATVSIKFVNAISNLFLFFLIQSYRNRNRNREREINRWTLRSGFQLIDRGVVGFYFGPKLCRFMVFK